MLLVLLSFVTSFAGSIAALIVWFHYDLEGYWDQHRHQRMLRRGAQRERSSKPSYGIQQYNDENPPPLNEQGL